MVTNRKILLMVVALFYSIPNYAIGQIDSIPRWINKVYISKSENLDSFRKEIFKQGNKDISIYKFKNYTDSIFKKDSSLSTMVKTIYILNILFKNMDTTLLKQIDYETRYYYYYLMQKMYVLIGAKNFPTYKEDYNAVFTKNHLFPITMNKDKRTIKLNEQYLSMRPQLIEGMKMFFFRLHNISEYNDIILKHILRSPDSVDFQDISFSTSLAGEALFTLLWFGDDRALSYYLYGVTHTPWEKTFFVATAFRVSKEHQSKAIQYMQLKILKSLFEKEGSTSMQICDFVGLTIAIEDYPSKMLLNNLSSTCPEELPYEKKYILEQKPPEEIKRVALDIIDKKLKELEKKK